GRRIGIRQHHLIPLRLQRLARLRARVVKLRRLPDHNRPRANHENFGDVIASWHLIGLQSNPLHSNPLVIHPARPQCLSRKPPPLSSRESAFLMLLSRGAPYACHPDAPRLLSSREAQRRGICSPPLTLTFHSEALVIPTPHACCHPEERSDEGSAVPHSPLRSIPRPLSSRRPTLVVIPRSAATRSAVPHSPLRSFRGPCHPDKRSDEGSAVPHSPLRSIPRPLSSRPPRLLSSRGAQRRGICNPPLTLTFHSEALVIPTPPPCCHPEERSDEGSAVPAYQPSDKSCHVGFTP